LFKARRRAIRCNISKLIIAIWNKEEMPEEWKQSIIKPIYMKGDKIDLSNIINYLQTLIQHPDVYANSIYRGNDWGSSTWIPTQQVNY
jgi:hypothetical protein